MANKPSLPFWDEPVSSCPTEKTLRISQESEFGSRDVPFRLDCIRGSDATVSPLCAVTSTLWRIWNLIKLENHKEDSDAEHLSDHDRRLVRSRTARRISHDSMRHDRMVDNAQREIEACYNGFIGGPADLEKERHMPRIRNQALDIIESWI